MPLHFDGADPSGLANPLKSACGNFEPRPLCRGRVSGLPRVKVDLPFIKVAPAPVRLAALTLLWLVSLTGCQQARWTQSDSPTGTPLASPKEATVRLPMPLVPAPPTAFAETTIAALQFKKSLPIKAEAGGTFIGELKLTARSPLTNLVVRDAIPVGATWQRSDPPAIIKGSELVWTVAALRAGENLNFKTWFEANTNLVPRAAATVTALPKVSAELTVGSAELALDASGPETAMLNADLTYRIQVRNIGSEMVRGVTIRQTAPVGTNFSNEANESTLDAGDLDPGQAKSFTTRLKAAQRGTICATITAQSLNAPELNTEVCSTIIDPRLQVQGTGAKEQVVGRNVDYEIAVMNVGDTPLTNVVISSVAPEEDFIVAAPGAVITGNQATWTVVTLQPRDRVTKTIKLTSKSAGVSCATITASAGAATDATRLCTLWKGIPALTFELSEMPDPIQVGESTTYRIVLINQGSGELHNLKVQAVFDDLMLPISSPQGTINGQHVTFPIIASIKAQQSVTYTISVKGAMVGTSHNRVEVICDEIKAPILREESTTIY